MTQAAEKERNLQRTPFRQVRPLSRPSYSGTFQSHPNIPHSKYPTSPSFTGCFGCLGEASRNTMEEKKIAQISVTWRGRQLCVDADPSCTVKEFGQLLQNLTRVKPETLKLIVPQSTNKGSKLITPFSDAHSSLKLEEAAINEGKPIRMMGVFDDEIEEVSDNGKRPDLRIIGFDEEEQRLKRRSTGRLQISLKLPQGPYIFCDFQTLHLPGIELNPLPSEALKRMHMLACDPGIIAIMNKHKWRVGIMTEMAPIGYVGVSPKCILGFNKNMGEEISLRLRTDDLKGFRKYESIKKTLLHELAHMVHSEHDANFFALNKQLNEEAASLDWTKSGGHVLSGRKIFDSYEDEFALEPNTSIGGRRLGGGSSSLASAHVLSGAAAYQRFLNASAREVEGAQNRVVASVKEGYVLDVEVQPDPEDAGQDFIQGKANVEPDPDDNDAMHVDVVIGASGPSDCRSFKEQDTVGYSKSDPDDAGKQSSVGFLEPDANDAISGQVRATHHGPEPADTGAHGIVVIHDAPGLGDHPTGRNMISVNMSESCNIDVMQKDTEPDPDDSSNVDNLNQVMSIDGKHHREPDPDDATCDIVLESGNKMEVETEQSSNITVLKSEPDPDDSSNIDILNQVPRIDGKHHREPNPAHANCEVVLESGTRMEVETEQSRNAIVSKSEPDPDDHAERSNSNELQRIEEPVAALCARLQKAIEMLRLQATPAEATSALQSLFKIIRNVIEHPNDIKYKRLRKSNPRFQRSVANYKAAMEVLEMIGFCEDVFLDEIGRAETYLVLKRNDPGLLWLAKSSLEVSMA